MTDMLRRARRLLIEPNDYSPGISSEGVFVEHERPRLFVVTDAMKVGRIDVSDIATNIANAAKENTAMTDRPEPLVDQLRTSFSTSKDQLTERRAQIAADQKKADDAFTANVNQLNDQIKSLTQIHENETEDFVVQLADADEALAGIDAGLNALPIAPIVAASPVKAG